MLLREREFRATKLQSFRNLTTVREKCAQRLLFGREEYDGKYEGMKKSVMELFVHTYPRSRHGRH